MKAIEKAKEDAAVALCAKHLASFDLLEYQASSDRPISYIAAVALLEYLGGVKAGYYLTRGSDDDGDHYWVTRKQGDDRLDPLADRFELLGKKPPYKSGVRVQRRNTFREYERLLEAMQADVAGQGEVNGHRFRPTGSNILLKGSDETKSQSDDDRLMKAWTAVVADWARQPEEFLRATFSKGALAMHFVRAMLYDEEIPRTATMAYTPHRFYVAGSAYPFNKLFPAAVKDPRLVRGIQFTLGLPITTDPEAQRKGNKSLIENVSVAAFNKLISSNLPISGYRVPADFPISLAKRLINTYCPKGGRMLDPCHGWGGRLVGFMLSRASHYTGIDPAPHSPCLLEMFDDLSPYLRDEKSCKLINKPFEDVGLKEARFDFALTSPPYYNTEKYDGEESSWRRYKSLDAWLEGFYRPLIEGVAYALKPGANFVLQVSPKFKMVERAREYGEEAGLKYEGVYDTEMRRYNSVTAEKGGSNDQFEVFAVFRKKGQVNELR